MACQWKGVIRYYSDHSKFGKRIDITHISEEPTFKALVLCDWYPV